MSFINIHVTGDTVPSDSGHRPYYKPHHSGALRIVDKVTQFLRASLPDASCRSLYSLCNVDSAVTLDTHLHLSTPVTLIIFQGKQQQDRGNQIPSKCAGIFFPFISNTNAPPSNPPPLLPGKRSNTMVEVEGRSEQARV